MTTAMLVYVDRLFSWSLWKCQKKQIATYVSTCIDKK